MPNPAPNTLAVIGAGPIGLEAALAALERDLDVHVFERGEPGANVRAWGHVRMFTPWRMNCTERGVAALAAQGWKRPDPEACPTGNEFADLYLEPLARLPQLRERLHTGAQVVHVSRRGTRKSQHVGDPGARRASPFRLLVRDRAGRESFLHAFAVVDASGVYGNHNWMGSGGIPARSELILQARISYLLDDVLDLQRSRYAGRRTLLVGAGHSAATCAVALAQLAREAPGTETVWVTRGTAEALYRGLPDDALPGRAQLERDARELIAGGSPAVEHVGGAEVEELEFNFATHRYRVRLALGDRSRVEEVHNVLALVGYGPDDSLYRELQIHECYASRGLMKLSAALLDAGAGDCLAVPASGADMLASPEPDFYVLGNKSYGRTPSFLLRTGHQQVEDVISTLAQRAEVATGA